MRMQIALFAAFSLAVSAAAVSIGTADDLSDPVPAVRKRRQTLHIHNERRVASLRTFFQPSPPESDIASQSLNSESVNAFWQALRAEGSLSYKPPPTTATPNTNTNDNQNPTGPIVNDGSGGKEQNISITQPIYIPQPSDYTPYPTMSPSNLQLPPPFTFTMPPSGSPIENNGGLADSDSNETARLYPVPTSAPSSLDNVVGMTLNEPTLVGFPASTNEPSPTPLQESFWKQVGSTLMAEYVVQQGGYAVDMSSDGSIVAISFPGFNEETGMVKVYKLENENWSQLGQDLVGSAFGNKFGWSVALSGSGIILAVGSPGSESNIGKTDVFAFISGSWSAMGNPVSGEAAGDNCGFSVSLDNLGLYLISGCPFSNTAQFEAGKAHIYQFDSATGWFPMSMSNGTTGNALFERYGYSVDMSGDGSAVVIGAPGAGSGQVIVMSLSGEEWVQQGQPLSGDLQGDNCGWNVKLSENGLTVVYGLPGAYVSGFGTDTGIIRRAFYVNGQWLEASAAIEGQAPSARVGESIALSADASRLAYYAGSTFTSGLVKVVKYDGNSWQPLGNSLNIPILTSDPYSLAIDFSGSKIFIGSPASNGPGSATLYGLTNERS